MKTRTGNTDQRIEREQGDVNTTDIGYPCDSFQKILAGAQTAL